MQRCLSVIKTLHGSPKYSAAGNVAVQHLHLYSRQCNNTRAEERKNAICNAKTSVLSTLSTAIHYATLALPSLKYLQKYDKKEDAEFIWTRSFIDPLHREKDTLFIPGHIHSFHEAVRQLQRLAGSILEDGSHPLHGERQPLPSGRRYVMPVCTTNTEAVLFPLPS